MKLLLLTDCTAPEAFFVSPLWVAEEKMDGVRLVIVKDEGGVYGVTRGGNIIALPDEIVALAMLSDYDFAIDGEMMRGARFVAFDIISIGGVEIGTGNSSRRELLEAMSPFELVRRVTGEQAKRDLWNETRCQKGEGIVFKHIAAVYHDGRSEWTQRLKHYETETFRVAAVSIARCSIEVEKDGVNYGGVPVGSLNNLPRVGDAVRVKYERVTESGKLLRAKVCK